MELTQINETLQDLPVSMGSAQKESGSILLIITQACGYLVERSLLKFSPLAMIRDDKIN